MLKTKIIKVPRSVHTRFPENSKRKQIVHLRLIPGSENGLHFSSVLNPAAKLDEFLSNAGLKTEANFDWEVIKICYTKPTMCHIHRFEKR